MQGLNKDQLIQQLKLQFEVRKRKRKKKLLFDEQI